jgi:hypothetical protein
MQGVGVVRRDFEDAAVDVRRRTPLLCLVKRDGDRDRFVERQGAVVARQRLCRDYTALLVLRSYLK